MRGRPLDKAASNRSRPRCNDPRLLRFRRHRATLWSLRLVPVQGTNTGCSRRWNSSLDHNHVSSPYICHQSSSSILRTPLDLHCNNFYFKKTWETDFLFWSRWLCNAVKEICDIKKKDVLIKVDDGVRHGDALRVLHFHHLLLLLGFALMFC